MCSGVWNEGNSLWEGVIGWLFDKKGRVELKFRFSNLIDRYFCDWQIAWHTFVNILEEINREKRFFKFEIGIVKNRSPFSIFLFFFSFIYVVIKLKITIKLSQKNYFCNFDKKENKKCLLIEKIQQLWWIKLLFK